MKDIKIDFINKKLINEYVENTPKTLQQIKLGVNIWQTDCLLDEDFGVNIDEQNLLPNQIKKIIKNAENVDSILSFNLNSSTSITGETIWNIDSVIKINGVDQTYIDTLDTLTDIQNV